jgi:hypothetical protein
MIIQYVVWLCGRENVNDNFKYIFFSCEFFPQRNADMKSLKRLENKETCWSNSSVYTEEELKIKSWQHVKVK